MKSNYQTALLQALEAQSVPSGQVDSAAVEGKCKGE